MTPREEEDELSSRDEDAVRRLLGAAHADRPKMPDDVAARLDRVVADLAAERAPARQAARRWPRVLVAAAAVSVIALGVGNILEDSGVVSGSGGSADSQSAADESAQEPARDGAVTAARQKVPAAPPGQTGPEAARGAEGDAGPTGLPRLGVATLPVEAQRIAEALASTPVRDDRGAVTSVRCQVPPTTRGDDTYAVLLDGDRAVLVLRRPADGQRVVELFACDDATDRLANTTVEVR